MPEPAQSIKTLLREANCSLPACFLRDIKELNCYQYDLDDPYNVAVSSLPHTSHEQTFKILDLLFSRPVSYFPWFRLMGMLTNEVKLNFHGRLITPFLCGSMSVRLSILIRHLSIDPWVCSMAWVRWLHTYNNRMLGPEVSAKDCWYLRRVIRMLFPMIQTAGNDRSVRRAQPDNDNWYLWFSWVIFWCGS